MFRYITRRILWLVFVILGLCAITFTLSRIVPSDPAESYLGPRPRPEQVEEVRIKLGLDKPLPVQFVY